MPVAQNDTDAFHAHLEQCSQCAHHPMALCITGSVLLQHAVQGEAPMNWPHVIDPTNENEAARAAGLDDPYEVMRSRGRRTAMLRLQADHPHIHRMLEDFTETMAAIYENHIEEKGHGWLDEPPESLARLLPPMHSALITAMYGRGESQNVIGRGASLALGALFVAVRVEQEKRDRRAEMGVPYYTRGFGIPPYKTGYQNEGDDDVPTQKGSLEQDCVEEHLQAHEGRSAAEAGGGDSPQEGGQVPEEGQAQAVNDHIRETLSQEPMG